MTILASSRLGLEPLRIGSHRFQVVHVLTRMHCLLCGYLQGCLRTDPKGGTATTDCALWPDGHRGLPTRCDPRYLVTTVNTVAE